MKMLAIETSCDETSVAIVNFSGTRANPKFQVLSHLVSSQVELHTKFGGVVPNLAKREHERNLVPLLQKALKESRIKNQESGKSNISSSHDSSLTILDSLFDHEPELLIEFKKKIISLPIPTIDVIAVTNGPGLAPALWVGINFARALSLLWKKPLIPMNHMKGHLFSALLQCGKKNDQFSIFNFQKNKKLIIFVPRIKFPLLALLVSGGHTELVLMKKFGHYQIIGETLDDAAGEAFDKVARMLQLGYPGGPAIAAAAKAQSAKRKTKNVDIKLPRPMLNSKDYNFSFSGLKTAVLYLLRDINNKKRIRLLRSAIAKEFQDAVVDVLVAKTNAAAQEHRVKTISVGGGVSANTLLRQRLSHDIKKNMPRVRLFLSHVSVTGDNALMIALAAFIDGKKKAPKHVGADANMRL